MSFISNTLSPGIASYNDTYGWILFQMTKYEELQEHLKSNQYTWLITGVAGFIGSNLARRLFDNGYKVTILDNLSKLIKRPPKTKL